MLPDVVFSVFVVAFGTDWPVFEAVVYVEFAYLFEIMLNFLTSF